MFNNSTWVIIDLLIFCYLLYLSFYGVKYNKNYALIPYLGNNYKYVIIIMSLFFCIYNKTEGDYFHYEETLKELTSTRYPSTHLEWPFLRIIDLIGNNYFLFRLIVWGSALLFVNRLLTLNEINNNWGWFCFVLIDLIAFAYVRASIGIALFYVGYTYILKRCFRYILYGSVCLICSFFFHKSIILLFGVGLLIPFFKVSIKNILIIFLSIPFILKLLYWGLGDFLLMWGRVDAIRYFNNYNKGYGIGAKIQIFLFIIGLTSFILYYLKQKLVKTSMFSIQEKFYLKFVIILFSMSLLLAFFDFGIYDLVTRIREMGYVPLALLIGSYGKHYKHLSKTVCFSLLMFLLSDLSYFGYMYYLKIIGSGI